LVDKCTLPLTGVAVVNRVITDLGVFDIKDGKIHLIRKADNVSVDEIIAKSSATIIDTL
jgi:3-oxoacid CoA-transferase subunit B